MTEQLAEMVRAARTKQGFSIRGAAKLAGISEARWRHIEAGVRSADGERKSVRIKPGTALAVADVLQLSRLDVLIAAGLPTVHAISPPAAVKPVEYWSDPVLVRAADAAPRALGEYIGRAVAVVLLDHEHDEHPDPNIHELAHCVLVLASIGKGGA